MDDATTGQRGKLPVLLRKHCATQLKITPYLLSLRSLGKRPVRPQPGAPPARAPRTSGSVGYCFSCAMLSFRPAAVQTPEAAIRSALAPAGIDGRPSLALKLPQPALQARRAPRGWLPVLQNSPPALALAIASNRSARSWCLKPSSRYRRSLQQCQPAECENYLANHGYRRQS